MKIFFRSSNRKFRMMLPSCNKLLQQVVDYLRNKTFRITCIDERSFHSFYVLVKIGRDVFGSMECASDVIPFPLGRDLQFPMCW